MKPKLNKNSVLSVLAALLASSLVADARESTDSSATTATNETETMQLDEAVLSAADTPQAEYRAEQASSVLKSGASLMETPRSVTVVTRELIEEQSADELHDLFRNVAGLNQQNFNGDFNLRGFRVNGGSSGASVLYDGLRGHVGSFTYRPTLVNVEQVQVLKGPSAMEHGTLSPGGVINIVSKKATAEAFGELNAEYGSFDRYGVGADVGGPIDEAGEFRYRLTADYLEHESHKDFIDVERSLFQPAFAWVPQDGTRLDLILLYTERDAMGERRRGTPDIEGDFFALPDNFTYNEPGDFNDVSILSAEVLFEHEFGENLRFDAGIRYAEDSGEQEYHEPRGAEPTFSDTVVDRQFRDQSREAETLQFSGSLSWEFETGDFAHSLMAGGDWSHLEEFGDFRTAVGVNHSSGLGTVPSLDILNPVYNAPGKSGYDFAPPRISEAKRELYGVFLKDEIRFGDREQWRLLGGLRWDGFKDEGRDLVADTESAFDDSQLSLAGGALYQWREDVSLYASYSEAFVPQSLGAQIDPLAGGPFDPEESWQVEAGVKKTWFDERFQTTLAAFFIEKENFLVGDPDDPDRLLPVGAVESQGIEFEGFGQLTEHFSLAVNVSFQNIEITETSPGEAFEVGDAPSRYVPEQSGAFWLRYDVPDTGLRLAFGPNWVGERESPISSGNDGVSSDDETLPSFVRWDAMVSYAHESGWSARLKVNNVFDKDHYDGGGFGNRFGSQRGAPLNAVLDVAYRF
jgi:iron complex outermembrane receptor protein